jgi:hypothetical protein
MHAPSHRIRTRNESSFSGSSSCSSSTASPSSSHTHILTNLEDLMVPQYPPGLGYSLHPLSSSSTSGNCTRLPRGPVGRLPYGTRPSGPPPQFKPSESASIKPLMDHDVGYHVTGTIHVSQQEQHLHLPPASRPSVIYSTRESLRSRKRGPPPLVVYDSRDSPRARHQTPSPPPVSYDPRGFLYSHPGSPVPPSVTYDSSPEPFSHNGTSGESYVAGTQYQLRPAEERVPPAIDPSPDKDSRSKLVAGMLLHRTHPVGKPMRRRPDGPKTYVRSGLSRAVSVECC